MQEVPEIGKMVVYRKQSWWVKTINPAVDDEVQIAMTPTGDHPRWVAIRYLDHVPPRKPEAKSPSQVRDKMTTGQAEALCRMVTTIADALGIGDDNPTVKMARWNVAELDLWRKHQA